MDPSIFILFSTKVYNDKPTSFLAFLGGALSLSFNLGSDADIILFIVANFLVLLALPIFI